MTLDDMLEAITNADLEGVRTVEVSVEDLVSLKKAYYNLRNQVSELNKQNSRLHTNIVLLEHKVGNHLPKLDAYA